ncbi:ribosome-associated translation inhibitor RaiA [Candidatus Babeliales bacterium]|nr:ribosome-associated translation inhibitor RaiA [Candidatus Babeliales bacterium]
MNIKISFQNMDHSNPLETHAREKLAKLNDILENAENLNPFNIELHLRANKLHPHHAAHLHVKTPRFDLNTQEEGTDLYVVVDDTIDKMVALLKKEKDKKNDKERKHENEKNKFGSDKY